MIIATLPSVPSSALGRAEPCTVTGGEPTARWALLSGGGRDAMPAADPTVTPGPGRGPTSAEPETVNGKRHRWSPGWCHSDGPDGPVRSRAITMALVAGILPWAIHPLAILMGLVFRV